MALVKVILLASIIYGVDAQVGPASGTYYWQSSGNAVDNPGTLERIENRDTANNYGGSSDAQSYTIFVFKPTDNTLNCDVLIQWTWPTATGSYSESAVMTFKSNGAGYTSASDQFVWTHAEKGLIDVNGVYVQSLPLTWDSGAATSNTNYFTADTSFMPGGSNYNFALYAQTLDTA